MATNTAENKQKAEDLERAHKKLFAYLVQGTNFYQNLLKKYPTTNPVLMDYSKTMHKVAKQWTATQIELEKAGVPKFRPNFFDFKVGNRNALNAKIKKMVEQSNQMGFIPIAIWAGAILGSMAIAYITKRLTTTTEDVAELQDKTLQTCTKLGLNADECKKYMFQQTNAATNGTGGGGGLFGGISIPWFVWVGGAALLAKQFGLFKSSKST